MSAGSAPTVELRLEVVAGPAAGEQLAIDERLVFGRQTDGPGRLAGDPELSRHHAELIRDPDGQFAIEDLSSTNGTFVNGERLTAPTVLAAGDVIDLGATRLIVRQAPPPPPPPRPPVDVRAATVIVDTVDETALPPEPEPDLTVFGATLAEAPSQASLGQPPTDESAEPWTEPAEPEPPTEATAPPAALPEPPAQGAQAAPAPAISLSGADDLDVRLVIDFERREAEIALAGTAEPLRLRVVDGRWQIADGVL